MTPSDQIRRRIRAHHAEAKCPPLTLRLVKYTLADREYTLATTLLDAKQFPRKAVSAVYHSRWEIEGIFKIAKQMMTVEQFPAQSERGVKQELYAHFVLITCTRVFSNHSEQQLQSPSEWLSPRKFQVNFKHALTVFASNLEALLLPSQNSNTVVATVLNCIRQCYQRLRPDRSYPRESKQPRDKWARRRSKLPAQAPG